MALSTKSITVHLLDGKTRTFPAECLLSAELQNLAIVVRSEPGSTKIERFFGLPLSTVDEETSILSAS